MSGSGGLSGKTPDGFRVRLAGGPRAASRARQELSRLRGDLDEPLLEVLRLLVTELITNSVRHAGAGTVDLLATVGPTKVRVEVLNDGHAFTPAAATDPSEIREGGWGLFLVERLSEEWGVEESSGRTIVWFELQRTR